MGDLMNPHAIRAIFRRILWLVHNVIHRRCGMGFLRQSSLRWNGFSQPL